MVLLFGWHLAQLRKEIPTDAGRWPIAAFNSLRSIVPLHTWRAVINCCLKLRRGQTMMLPLRRIF